MRRLVRHCAFTGLFFWGPATNAYVLTVLALLVVAIGTLSSGLVVMAAGGLGTTSGILLVGSFVAAAAGLLLFHQRSKVVDRALARTHFNQNGAATRLREVPRSIDHVFCATELQSGDHLYLTATFVYGYRFGTGVPGDLKLSTAVQASACLPGAFAARRLATRPHRFTRSARVDVPVEPAAEMVIIDGGVYDNMADQWLVGLARRLSNALDLPVRTSSIDEIVVANASAGLTWRPFPAPRVPIVGEIRALMRAQAVQYDVTTSHRRGNLIRWFDDAAGQGQQVGALVHIAQSPYRVADRYIGAPDGWPDRASRSKDVLAFLGDDQASRVEWSERAERNATTPTVLRKLGRDPTAELLYHAYVLAACNLHVLLGYPLPQAKPTRQQFADYVGNP
jgi:predicted acylesterase/phospholipase RssA